MKGSRDAFFQRVAASLIIPITFLPLAAILLAAGMQLHIAPLEGAGQAMIRNWLPLFYGIGISIGFTEADGMGALTVATGFLVMVSVAERASGDPTLNVGVLGGLVAGAVSTWLYNKVKHVELPEYLALFSGKRLGPQVAALAGVALGYVFGWTWPWIQSGIIGLGTWIHGAGAVGAFAYGSVLRLLIPTGLHHILMQLVDTQMGGWVDPVSGKLVAGEYLRFLAGDPGAGRILSGFFVTLGFAPVGAAFAMIHEARPEQRRRVTGLMITGILTAMVLGVTEPVEFAFIFASPVLFGLHVVFSGLASWLGYALGIRLGGYALPMILINWHQSEKSWMLLPLGLAYVALYYFSFRVVIRWLRPPILGQTAEVAAAPGRGVVAVEASPELGAGEGAAYVAALGGAANLTGLEACMTRLRITVQDQQAVDESRLAALGAGTVLLVSGGAVQVVVGARAGAIAARMRAAIAPGVVTLLSPLTGRVVPLADVPDEVFARRLAGDGLAIEPTDGRIVAPVTGRVMAVFPGGHALGIATAGGLEVLVHIGVGTVTLVGEGFAIRVREGDQVAAGDELGHCDLTLIAARGKPLVSPVLITNMDRVGALIPLSAAHVNAGEPVLRVELRSS